MKIVFTIEVDMDEIKKISQEEWTRYLGVIRTEGSASWDDITELIAVDFLARGEHFRYVKDTSTEREVTE